MKLHSLIATLALPLGLLAQEPPEKSARIITRDSAAPEGEARVALIMGVSDVGSARFPVLPGIKQDMTRMRSALQAANFEIIELNEPTLAQAHQALDSFGDKLRSTKGVGLFYFTGHGGEYDGVNYLFPKGALISRNVDVTEQAISTKRVLNRMEDQGTRVNIVFLDCCRSELTKSGSGPGLANMSARGTFIGFATASEKVAGASRDGSPYTTFLCKHISTPGLSIGDMHTLVTADVQDHTRERNGVEQTPFSYSGLRSTFYFIPGSAPAMPPPAGPGMITPLPGMVTPAEVETTTMQLAAGVDMVFVKCAPGSYYIGSPKTEAGRGDDETAGSVRFTDEFWIARTECTQAQWQALMKTNPSEFQGPQMPVNNVTYLQALEFCEAMNRKLPNPKGRFTLPTEAQWEYACRGDNQAAFSFGKDAGDLHLYGNYADRSYTDFDHGDQAHSDGVGNATAPVASYRPNAWGLYDMHGNVFEWCRDVYNPYPPTGTNPLSSPFVGPQRVMRGGAWHSKSEECRSANRNAGPTNLYRNSVGFRVVFMKS
ncbi:MAG: SUMF1/EgtB/PvdO family nonheme iron enzyme [Verrucomicrobiota bacterium]